MAISPASCTVTIQGTTYLWTPEAGLDPAVVTTVEPWIRREARAIERVANRRGIDLEDLLQAGRLGALEAARRFNPRHTSYLAYAKFIIRRQLHEALGQADEIHQSRIDKRAALKAGTLPTVLRLEKPLGDDLALGDLLQAADPILERAEEAERVSFLRRALTRLDGQERLLLALRHGLGEQPPLSLRETGLRLTPPVDHERARQLQKRAEAKLRGALRELGLNPVATGFGLLPSPPPPEPPRPPQAKATCGPPTPGTRREVREARRARLRAALGTPLPLEIPA